MTTNSTNPCNQTRAFDRRNFITLPPIVSVELPSTEILLLIRPLLILLLVLHVRWRRLRRRRLRAHLRQFLDHARGHVGRAEVAVPDDAAACRDDHARPLMCEREGELPSEDDVIDGEDEI